MFVEMPEPADQGRQSPLRRQVKHWTDGLCRRVEITSPGVGQARRYINLGDCSESVVVVIEVLPERTVRSVEGKRRFTRSEVGASDIVGLARRPA